MDLVAAIKAPQMKVVWDLLVSIGGSIVGAITANASHIGWLLRQGVGWVMMLLVLHWVGTNMLIPMQAAHLELVKEVAKNNTAIARAEDKQTTLLEEIVALLRK